MPAIPTKAVLEQEALAIHGANVSGESGMAALYRKLNGLDRYALCLSGGGIRSASFALGIIEALAAHPRSSDGGRVAKAEASYLADETPGPRLSAGRLQKAAKSSRTAA